MILSRGHAAILLAFLVWVSIFAVFLQLHLTTPWLGATFKPAPQLGAIEVVSVTRGGPAEQAGLIVGQRLTALTGPSGAPLPFTGYEAVLGRHQTPNFAIYNETRAAKQAIWPLLHQSELVFTDASGAQVRLAPETSPGIGHMKFETFLKVINALVVILVAVGIWVFAPGSFAVTLLAISGVGLATNIMGGAILSSSEMTIAPAVFHGVITISSWGGATFSYALLAVIWHFPSKLTRWPVSEALLALGAILQVNLAFQVVELPINSFEVSHLIPAPIALVASLLQWRNTHGKPLERASVMWFSMSIYGLVTIVLTLYSMPLVLNVPILLSPAMANVFLALIFFGIALGTLRYRLFDVHRIWLRAVLWAIGGLLVLVVDLGFVWIMNLDHSLALLLALLVAGWIYFPSRNKLAELVLGSKETTVAAHIPDLIKRFNTLRDEEEVNGRFIGFLASVYRISEVASIDDIPLEKAEIENHGLFLRVPLVTGGRSALLVGKAKGRQLFSRADRDSADSFLTLVRSFHQGNMQQLRQMEAERQRITRDLHDDVGGKLLTMIYQAPDQTTAEQARAALQALRETVYVVEDQQTIEAKVAWQQIFAEMQTALGSELTVDDQSELDRDLSAREYVNLKRIIQEVTSNALKYAQAGSLEVKIDSDAEDGLHLRFRNLINAVATQEERGLRGLLNIRKRVEEMGGEVQIKDAAEPDGLFDMKLTIPAP